MTPASSPSREFEFTLVLTGFERLTDAVEDALYGAGCDDAVLGVCNRVPYLAFDREASSLEDAVLSAIRDVHATGIARVRRVEPDDAVTSSEIARRAGRTRQSVQQLVRGVRGGGDFPSPIAGLRTRSPSWSWAEVAAWFHTSRHAGQVDAETVRSARFLALLNHMLGWPAWADEEMAQRIRRRIAPVPAGNPASRERTGSMHDTRG